MGGSNYQQFFLRPEDSVHRRYESLRAVFVDGLAMADVAKRFGVAYGTVRNWAHEFRALRDQAESSPFFLLQHGDVPSMLQRSNPLPKNRKWQTRRPCLSKWDAG